MKTDRIRLTDFVIENAKLREPIIAKNESYFITITLSIIRLSNTF
jgi:hypothetical protein